MNRTNLTKKQNARAIQAISNAIEGLESRQLLANTPVAVGNFTIGTAVWLNIVGTAGDDTIVVQKTAATTFRITNGTWAMNKTGTYAGVRVLAGAGADSVSTTGSLSFRLFAYGEAGNDTLTGGSLADSLFGGADNDSLVGGIGNDTLRGEAGNDTHVGGAGNDNALGGLGDDLFNGGDGNDLLGGDAGADTVNGDAGNDTLQGGTEADSLSGGAGADLLTGGTDADVLDGGADNDTLNGEAGNDTLTGAAGNDSLNGGADNDSVDGGDGNDRVMGDAGTDVYIGGTGTDTIDYTGRTVSLTLSFDGEANDGATGELDNIPDDFESLLGGNLGDVITGNSANNVLNGGAGNDTVDGLGGNDRVYGGVGADSISGGEGNDSLWGQADNDLMYGNGGEDLLEGGLGNDQYFGGAGRDRLIALGGGVADSLTGGDDMDSYWLDSDSTEKLLDVSAEETTARATHRVGAFMKYGTTVISKELNSPKLAEPTKHASLASNSKVVNYASYKLFADAGPDMDDVKQGQAGDCWWLSSLSGVAKISPETIRQSITDLGDGTFAARFYNTTTRAEQYVRIDADLYTYSWTSNTPTYAGLGAESSTWVAMMEKAFTWVRSGGGTLGRYQTIDGGWMSNAYAAMGLTNRAPGWGNSYANAGAALDFIRAELDAGHTVTMGTKSSVSYNMVGGHAYVIDHVTDNGNGTYSIVLRNPWGVDNNTSNDGANDGYVTLTPAQLFATYSGLAAA